MKTLGSRRQSRPALAGSEEVLRAANVALSRALQGLGCSSGL